MQQLQATKAAQLWSYFLTICSIPHPSKHEQQLVAWIIDWAKHKNISCIQDTTGNLILRKPASAGYENKTAVILQAHLDMVPQKNSQTKHDFLTDPIIPVIDGEWLHAENTTLGADNGIGMASCLAVLADNTIAHGPLEVLLTTDEETGMTGAFGLQANALQGKTLINTDSEQEGELYIGCAGGINVNIDLPYEIMEAEPADNAYEISLCGLKGGHSGCDINLQRGNAIKILADVLHNLNEFPFHLALFEGGSLRNAIPREARTVIVCNQQYQHSLEIIINSLQLELANKFHHVEAQLQLTVKACQLPAFVLTNQSQTNILNSLTGCENGVFTMDDDFSDVVKTSSNLGMVTQNMNEQIRFEIQVLIRSQLEQEKQLVADKISEHYKVNGGLVRQNGNYPGWKPNPTSTIYKVMEAQYSKLFDKKPKAMVIHAGLECGLFSDKYPHWDMISFGPTIKFPHSPDEKVHIASVDKYWQLLVATLAAID
ncbi:aminoacyl-histidine dipeptidase [Psychromonas antarctica]|uniref:aminoacyl-histidine dipeptidase n=1 Tax=Psychromonas antarctica TaxID=67573 RepID=UPI001EE906EE|nr:aminoacyl-histidine dipeptidase [Psychromonas antarctica]MCG6199986.1 aminoacyl-histidine dipeptidase [Psychromonas antarctica]